MTKSIGYDQQVAQTLQSLQAVDDTTLVGLTRLGLAEVQELKHEVASIFPASNLPALLLQGLIQLRDRDLQPQRVAADLGVLFRSTRHVGLVGAFLATPALIIQGYQRLLTLAGKNPESAFPNGSWQFYTEFGLREDAARHCVETIGFQRASPVIDAVDAATCWVATALAALHAYDDLLENEWAERVLPRTLNDLLREHAEMLLAASLPKKAEARARAIADHAETLAQQFGVERLASAWAAVRPYHGPPSPHFAAYIADRRVQFQTYLDTALQQLPENAHAALGSRFLARKAAELPLYQAQMSMLAMLEAGTYQDRRVVLGLDQAVVALAVAGQYYLLDACARDAHGQLLVFPSETNDDAVPLALVRDADGTLRDRYQRPVTIARSGAVLVGERLLGRLRPPTLAAIKAWVQTVLQTGAVLNTDPTVDLLLSEAPRERQQALRGQLDPATQAALAQLRCAPIILNWDMADDTKTLTAIRRAHRGIGDHALTLLRTEQSMVFDLSHIFFDGSWGMALAEMLTAHATQLIPMVQATSAAMIPPTPALTLVAPAPFVAAAKRVIANTPVEIGAETTSIDLELITKVRRRLGRRTMPLTVNDLLVLTRCAQPASYQPGPLGQRALERVAALDTQVVQQFEAHIAEQRQINPALLIPMDASATDPRLRLFPATFRNSLLELVPRLDRCNRLVQQLQQQDNSQQRAQFEHERRLLAADLQRFTLTLQVLKRVTMQGESMTTAALRLLGPWPGAIQQLLDQIPQKISALNEILKGREVFSNVGQVAASSSLTRFASARDDGETKLLIWGIMSDASGQLVVTLRDFRPHVAPLVRMGRADLAQLLAQDYLEHYAALVNAFARRLQRVLAFQ
jgi:hypothetical protein